MIQAHNVTMGGGGGKGGGVCITMSCHKHAVYNTAVYLFIKTKSLFFLSAVFGAVIVLLYKINEL